MPTNKVGNAANAASTHISGDGEHGDERIWITRLMREIQGPMTGTLL
jgi:hypothetical protein